MINQILSSRLLNLEQIIFINWFNNYFNRDIAGIGNFRHIANIEKLEYEGAIVATEFLIYNQTKLYLCFEFSNYRSAVPNNLNAFIRFYDEGNNMFLYSANNNIEYEPIIPAIIYANCNNVINNLYFSRLVSTNYNAIKFNGYRITLD